MSNDLSLSALQHYLYCPRQCALIHVENVWEENLFTAEGRLLHRRVDSGATDGRERVAQDRSVPIRSEKLGLYGVADMLEAHTEPNGQVIFFPVEYKRGRPKIEDWDRAQLCAQAICLEEMLNITIERGAIFYGKPRRRERVIFDIQLREMVDNSCRKMHEMIRKGVLPPPSEKKDRCKSCSLIHVCMPGSRKRYRVESYLLKGLEG